MDPKQVLSRAGIASALLGMSGFAQAVVAITPVPELIDASKPAFYVIETPVLNGGNYMIFNNTTNLRLLAFGVTNPDTSAVAVIDGLSDAGFVTYSNGITYDFWGAFNLSLANWNDDILGAPSTVSGTSAQALYGDIGTVLGADGYANYFEAWDAYGLTGGVSGWDFGFRDALPASTLFGAAVDEFDNVYTFNSIAAVPEPEIYALTLVGLGLVGWMARRAKR